MSKIRLDICPFCTATLSSTGRFCAQCGRPIEPDWAAKETPFSFMGDLITMLKGVQSTLDADVLLRRISQSADKLLQAEATSIMILDESKKNLTFKVATGEQGAMITRSAIRVGEGIAGWVAEHKQSVLVDDIANEPRFDSRHDEMTGFKTRSVLSVPMMAGAELIGVMEVLNKKAVTGFLETDQSILEAFASLAAHAIVNAKLVGSLRNYFSNTLELFIGAIEATHVSRQGRSWQVAEHCNQVGKMLGVQGRQVKDLHHAALLYDIGVLSNPQKGVSDASHPLLGSIILNGIDLFKGSAAFVAMHHEAYDGSGFPRGLKGEQMPIAAHILLTVVACEELRYKKSTEEGIIEYLKQQAGKRFHPHVAQAYCELIADEIITKSLI